MYLVHCTPYTVHRTLYTVHCTPYTVHRTSYIVHCTQYTVHRTLYTVHCTPYTVHRTLYTVHCTPYTVHRSRGVSARGNRNHPCCDWSIIAVHDYTSPCHHSFTTETPLGGVTYTCLLPRPNGGEGGGYYCRCIALSAANGFHMHPTSNKFYEGYINVLIHYI